MDELFNNGLIQVSCETNDYKNGHKKEKVDKLTVTIPRNGMEDIKVSFVNDGYGIDKNDDINEYNLCNKILYEVFEEHDTQNITIPKQTADYLIDTSKQSKIYEWEDGELYYLPNLRIAYINRILKYNSKIKNKYAIKANEILAQMVQDTNEDNLKFLVNNDLHFTGRKDGEDYDQRDDIFGEVIPVYTCKRSKVNGIIKHMYNKMVKDNVIHPTAMDQETFLKKLKCILDRENIYISAKDIISDYNVTAFLDCQNEMQVTLKDGESIMLAYTNSDGESCTISGIGVNKFDRLIELITTNIVV